MGKGPNGKGEVCTYCRRTLEAQSAPSRLAATRDHVHPRSLGGTRKVWCCWACNSLKANKTAEQWSEFMKANPEWWKLCTWQRHRTRHKRGEPIHFAPGDIRDVRRICGNCRHYMALSPGQAAICIEKWRHLAWNEAVPLTAPTDSCVKFAARPLFQVRASALISE